MLIKRNIRIPLNITKKSEEFFLLNRTNMSSLLRDIIKKIINNPDEIDLKKCKFKNHKKKSINFYIHKTEWDKFKNIAKEKNIPMSDLISFYLEKIFKEGEL